MKLWVIAVGHKMPAWAENATQDYLKRMPADCAIQIKELKPDISPAKEAIKIREALPKGVHIIGKKYMSVYTKRFERSFDIEIGLCFPIAGILV